MSNLDKHHNFTLKSDSTYFINVNRCPIIEIYVDELIGIDSLELPDEFVSDHHLGNYFIRVYTSAVDDEYNKQVEYILKNLESSL